MTKRLLLCLCVGVAAMLAACTPDSDDTSLTPAPSPKQLKVQYTELKHPAGFVHAAARLAPGEAAKLDAFLDGARVTSEDHVYLEVADSDKLAAQRIGAVSRALADRGIGAKVLPAADKEVGADELLVKVERYVVTLPDCPDWTKSPYQFHDNKVGSNFGCATTTNLGLMVADPRDLAVGRTLGPQEGDPALLAIERYRAGKPKDLLGQSSGGGGGGYSPVTIQMPGSSGGSGQ
jgi:pilus assembly protein CpaD